MSNALHHDLDHVVEGVAKLWEELRGARVFITGATGFFGCWLVESFLWANQQMGLGAHATILTRNPGKFYERLPHLGDADIEVISGDIRNSCFPEGEFSHVIHAATESSAELNARNPQLMFETIVEGTQRCLEFAALAGARKFLFTSSGAVYGKQPPELPHLPEDFSGSPNPLHPDSAYGEGKRAAELRCTFAIQKTGLEVKVARCFTFVGPYMKLDAHFAIGNFIRDLLEGERVLVRGDGTPVRSYMYASDLMVWLWTILFRGETGRAYNVGSEEEISIADLAREVANAAGTRTPFEILGKPAPGALPARYVPNTARAREELGLRCTIPLREAIERTLEWNRRQRRALALTAEVLR